MARTKTKTQALGITPDTFDEVIGENFGTDRVQVRQGRVVHWPESSEIRAKAGEILYKGDPWLEGQGHKLLPYDGDEKPSTPKEVLTRQRLKSLEAKLAERGEEPPKVKAERAGTRRKAASSPKKAAGRQALEEAADGADPLVGLDNG